MHVVELLVRDRDIQNDGEGRTFPQLALAVDDSVHQIHHLFRDRKAEAGALNGVDAAVCLAGEGFVHLRHELGTHTHARICNDVGQLDTARLFASLLPQIYADASARLRVFDRVGKDVDVNLIQAQLIGIQILLFHTIDPEIEVDILFLDHRLGDVDQVLDRIDDREGQWAQIQLAALHLGDIQDIVDQRQKMIAGEADFPEIIGHRFRVPQILLRNGRQAHNGVHRRADIMGHGRKEIGFRFVCGLRFLRKLSVFLVEKQHIHKIDDKDHEQPKRNNTGQQPILRVPLQIVGWYEAQKHPSARRSDRGMRQHAVPPSRICHWKGSRSRHEGGFQFIHPGRIDVVVRLVEFKEIVVFEGAPLDDVIALFVDHGKFRVLEFFLRENPLFLEIRERNDPEQERVSLLSGVFIPERDFVAEGKGLFAIHRIGIGAGDVDRSSDRGDPLHIAEQTDILIGNSKVIWRSDTWLRGKAA